MCATGQAQKIKLRPLPPYLLPDAEVLHSIMEYEGSLFCHASPPGAPARRGREGGREGGIVFVCELCVCVCQDRHKRRRKRSREAHSTLSNGIFPLHPPPKLHTPTPLRPPIHRGTHNHPPSMGRHDLLTAHTTCAPPPPPPRLSPLSTPRAVTGDLRGPLARTSTPPRAPRHTLPLSCTPTPPPPPLPPAPPSSPSNLK
jgi:hypothetical protein